MDFRVTRCPAGPGNEDHRPGSSYIIPPDHSHLANQCQLNTDLKVLDPNARLPSQGGIVPSTAHSHFTLDQVLDHNLPTAIELIKCQTDISIKPKILRGLDIEGVDFPT